MDAETKRLIVHVKTEANAPKRDLIRLLDQLENRVDNLPAARQLAKIIERLERWQNS